MRGGFVPGDVAMIHAKFHAKQVAIRTERGWTCADGEGIEGWVNARPLVVIDPEDREQVERLTTAVLTNNKTMFRKGGSYFEGSVDIIEAALRSLVTPPKPPEPQGLGAVVEDADGRHWVRSTFADPNYYGWRCAQEPQASTIERYAEITAVKVLSEGVTP